MFKAVSAESALNETEPAEVSDGIETAVNPGSELKLIELVEMIPE